MARRLLAAVTSRKPMIIALKAARHAVKIQGVWTFSTTQSAGTPCIETLGDLGWHLNIVVGVRNAI